MITVRTAPDETISSPSIKIFIAGGISNCPDWQSQFIGEMESLDDLLRDEVVNRWVRTTQAPTTDFRFELFNPRRTDFDVSNPSMSEAQIKWEYDRLKISDIVVFWFPEETLCPITLFELGKCINTVGYYNLFVGCHPNYKRKFDVIEQLKLSRKDVDVVHSMDDLMWQLYNHFKNMA